ncbi:MAG: hypothetical protein HY393_01245 [Candidatus Diapherotrites archaeon]|nr:hypothetical protein [Candidatus Diapherotrites archaeon]
MRASWVLLLMIVALALIQTNQIFWAVILGIIVIVALIARSGQVASQGYGRFADKISKGAQEDFDAMEKAQGPYPKGVFGLFAEEAGKKTGEALFPAPYKNINELENYKWRTPHLREKSGQGAKNFIELFKKFFGIK